MTRTRTAARPARWRAAGTAALLAAVLVGCSPAAPEEAPAPAASEAAEEPTDGPAPAPGQSAEEAASLPGLLTLTSPDLDADGRLPAWATGAFRGFCEGDNRSPSFTWTDAPAGTAGYVLLMTDVADPGFVHWVVTGIPGDATGLAPADDGQVAEGVVGSSLAGPGRYVGPCVVDNSYRFVLHALDEPVTGGAGTSLSSVAGSIAGHVLDTAELVVSPYAGEA